MDDHQMRNLLFEAARRLPKGVSRPVKLATPTSWRYYPVADDRDMLTSANIVRTVRDKMARAVADLTRRIDTEIGPVRYLRQSDGVITAHDPSTDAVVGLYRTEIERQLVMAVGLQLPTVDEWAAWWKQHGTRLI